MKTRFATIVLSSLFAALIAGSDAGSVSDTNTRPAMRYDPDSTSEENRQMVRDQMIKQGTAPNEAEAFTSELYKAEREHRRNQGLPD